MWLNGDLTCAATTGPLYCSSEPATVRSSVYRLSRISIWSQRTAELLYTISLRMTERRKSGLSKRSVDEQHQDKSLSTIGLRIAYPMGMTHCTQTFILVLWAQNMHSSKPVVMMAFDKNRLLNRCRVSE